MTRRHWVVWVFLFVLGVAFPNSEWMLWFSSKYKPYECLSHLLTFHTSHYVSISCSVMPVSPLCANSAKCSVGNNVKFESTSHSKVLAAFSGNSRNGQWSCCKVQEGTGQMLMAAISSKSVLELLEPKRVISPIQTKSQIIRCNVTATIYIVCWCLKSKKT